MIPPDEWVPKQNCPKRINTTEKVCFCCNFLLLLKNLLSTIEKTQKHFPKHQGLRAKLVKGFLYALFYPLKEDQYIEDHASRQWSRKI
jgi:hypothetical protein